jgi:hypothetical protein
MKVIKLSNKTFANIGNVSIRSMTRMRMPFGMQIFEENHHNSTESFNLDSGYLESC